MPDVRTSDLVLLRHKKDLTNKVDILKIGRICPEKNQKGSSYLIIYTLALGIRQSVVISCAVLFVNCYIV